MVTSLPELQVDRSPLKALRSFDADRLGWLDRATALGPVVAMRMGPIRRTWVVTDPDVARSMLVTDSAAWTRPPATVVPIRLAIGENLFTQADKAWALLQPEVAPSLRKRALDARLADLDSLIAREVEAIPLDTTVDLELAMGRIALVLAAWVMFGDVIDGARAEEIARHQREAVGWVGRQVGKINGFIPLAVGQSARVMKQHTAVLDQYADEVIARGRTRGDDDVLGALVWPAARGAGAARPRARVAPCRQRDHRGRALVGARARRPQPERLEAAARRTNALLAAVPHGDAAAYARRVGDPAGPHPRRRDVVGPRLHEPRAARPGRNDLLARHEPRRAAVARSAVLRPEQA